MIEWLLLLLIWFSMTFSGPFIFGCRSIQGEKMSTKSTTFIVQPVIGKVNWRCLCHCRTLDWRLQNPVAKITNIILFLAKKTSSIQILANKMRDYFSVLKKNKYSKLLSLAGLYYIDPCLLLGILSTRASDKTQQNRNGIMVSCLLLSTREHWSK